jgi:hypothetical protein
LQAEIEGSMAFEPTMITQTLYHYSGLPVMKLHSGNIIFKVNGMWHISDPGFLDDPKIARVPWIWSRSYNDSIIRK